MIERRISAGDVPLIAGPGFAKGDRSPRPRRKPRAAGFQATNAECAAYRGGLAQR